jgi:AcrR family transcriptional regulator
MPYRRTEAVVRRLAARHQAILDAARDAAAEGGMAAVQIVPVAERAGIAAGTVYRYFPAKTDLVRALVDAVSETELAAMRQAADAAPGPLSALAAAIVTFAARALRQRRLAWALLGETQDGDGTAYRRELVDELEARLRAAMEGGHLPEQDLALAAPALVAALLEGLVGPLAPEHGDEASARAAVQTLTLFALRGLGVVDARARGLVVQTAMPSMAAVGPLADRTPV